MNSKRVVRKMKRRVMRMIRWLFGVKDIKEANELKFKCIHAIERKTGKRIGDTFNIDDFKKVGKEYCIYETLVKLIDLYMDAQLLEFDLNRLEEDYGY